MKGARELWQRDEREKKDDEVWLGLAYISDDGVIMVGLQWNRLDLTLNTHRQPGRPTAQYPSTVCQLYPLYPLLTHSTQRLLSMSFVKLSIFGTSFEARRSSRRRPLHNFTHPTIPFAPTGDHSICRPAACWNGSVIASRCTRCLC